MSSDGDRVSGEGELEKINVSEGGEFSDVCRSGDCVKVCTHVHTQTYTCTQVTFVMCAGVQVW